MACTSKNSFKMMLLRKYPHIKAKPLVSKAYWISDRLGPQDNLTYHVTAAKEGGYIAKIPDKTGRVEQETIEVPRISTNGGGVICPTTDQAFRGFMLRNGITILHRVRLNKGPLPKPTKDFCGWEGPDLHSRTGWVIYTIDISTMSLSPAVVFKNIPHCWSKDSCYAMIAARSTYVPGIKEQREAHLRKTQPYIERFAVEAAKCKTLLEHGIKDEVCLFETTNLYDMLCKDLYPGLTFKPFSITDYDRGPDQTVEEWLRAQRTDTDMSDVEQNTGMRVEQIGSFVADTIKQEYTVDDYLKAFDDNQNTEDRIEEN